MFTKSRNNSNQLHAVSRAQQDRQPRRASTPERRNEDLILKSQTMTK